MLRGNGTRFALSGGGGERPCRNVKAENNLRQTINVDEKMQHLKILSLLAILAAVAGGCANRAMRVPLTPYVAGDVATRQINRVVVLPVVMPDYLIGKGGEAVSVEITNRFMSELAGRRLFNLVGGQQVQDKIIEVHGNLQDWLFEGDLPTAIKIGRELKVDGVVFGVVRRYVQANVDQTEVEVQFDLVEIASLETVWSVRELMIGKGGPSRGFGPVTTPTTRELSEKAVAGAAERVGQIYETGGPITVETGSTYSIWGYSLLTAGAIVTVTAGYFFIQSTQSYAKYQDANSSSDLARYRDETEDSDLAWMILTPVGASLVAGGLYLILSDPARQYLTMDSGGARIAIAPTVARGRFGLGCVGEF